MANTVEAEVGPSPVRFCSNALEDYQGEKTASPRKRLTKLDMSNGRFLTELVE